MTAVIIVFAVVVVFGAFGWWIGARPQPEPGRHRATGAGYTPPAADHPPIPSATRRQIRESGR